MADAAGGGRPQKIFKYKFTFKNFDSVFRRYGCFLQTILKRLSFFLIAFIPI